MKIQISVSKLLETLFPLPSVVDIIIIIIPVIRESFNGCSVIFLVTLHLFLRVPGDINMPDETHLSAVYSLQTHFPNIFARLCAVAGSPTAAKKILYLDSHQQTRFTNQRQTPPRAGAERGEPSSLLSLSFCLPSKKLSSHLLRLSVRLLAAA